MTFPDGKRFAFTIVDDTDSATVESVRPVYDLLASRGLRTTKTVWVYPPTVDDELAGQSLADDAYRDFVQELARQGFEIALHGVRHGGAKRDEIERGLDRFREVVGTYPRMHINHASNIDNLAWGHKRFGLLRWVYRLRSKERFEGDCPGSPHYWADLAERHIDYVRNLTFGTLNTRRADPFFPYRYRRTPGWAWFSGSDAADADAAARLLTREAIDRLEAQGGVAIVYAHFGKGFVTGGRVDTRFVRAIDELASRPGWFVPASTVLDHLVQQRGAGVPTLGFIRRSMLELKWLFGKLVT